jgi:hypothetical protein
MKAWPVTHRIAALATKGVMMMYRGYMDKDSQRSFSGFKENMTKPGGQGNDVYKHVNFTAGAMATLQVWANWGMQMIDGYENHAGHPQGPAEIRGDIAGAGVGFDMWRATLTQNYAAARTSIRKQICQ